MNWVSIPLSYKRFICIFKHDNIDKSYLEVMKTILRWQNLKEHSHKKILHSLKILCQWAKRVYDVPLFIACGRYEEEVMFIQETESCNI